MDLLNSYLVVSSPYFHGKTLSTIFILTHNCSICFGNIIGELDFRVVEPSEQTRQVTRIIRHPLYQPEVTGSQDYDFALLELERPVRVTRNVRPICLPKGRRFTDTTFDDETCTITGWGATNVIPPENPDDEPTRERTPVNQNSF